MMKRLSEHDRAILRTIFDPLLPLGEPVASSTDKDILEDHIENYTNPNPEVAAIIKLGIAAAEDKRFEEALRYFDEALKQDPNSPYVLNDRAQALRLAGRDEAMNDLNLAVELSGGKGKAGIRALCQRAALHRSFGKIEEARQDFSMAANGGSSFARSQMVAMNPYAAMCNDMLRQITSKPRQS
ncbi:tetratricopeptide repeat protein 36 isoform X3 [Cephus cinctus]|uniref:Tetratricopeptide repeat protein 36 isoform X3 n=1 Tax=Cephus cinctus TaxID=211228 RepID=A0AAJ7W275_CEPCN|nr:tetratricopeptide repeat protein 36 isoform X3 [Cephus cinctus]